MCWIRKVKGRRRCNGWGKEGKEWTGRIELGKGKGRGGPQLTWRVGNAHGEQDAKRRCLLLKLTERRHWDAVRRPTTMWCCRCQSQLTLRNRQIDSLLRYLIASRNESSDPDSQFQLALINYNGHRGAIHIGLTVNDRTIRTRWTQNKQNDQQHWYLRSPNIANYNQWEQRDVLI